MPRPPGLLLAESAAHFAASVGHVPGGRDGCGATVLPGCQGLEGTGEPGAPLPPLWDEESRSPHRGQAASHQAWYRAGHAARVWERL